MISEGLIIALIVCVGLTILGFYRKNLPIVFVSSIGYLISGLMIFKQTEEILPFFLLLMFAFGQFVVLKKEAA